jgi:O-antigen/teichoic acid export membrane protein
VAESDDPPTLRLDASTRTPHLPAGQRADANAESPLDIVWLDTASLVGISQTVTGPLVGLDQFQTGSLLRIDLLETAPLTAVPRVQPESEAGQIGTAQGTQLAARVPEEKSDWSAELAALDTLVGPAYVPPMSDVPSPWNLTTLRIKAIIPAAEGYLSLIRKLLKSSGLYAIGALATPLVSLMLTPFLAHFLSQSEYGVLAVLNTLIALASGITQLGLGAAFFRAYNYDYTATRDRRAVLATALVLLVVVSVPCAILAAAAAPGLASLIFGHPEDGGLVALAAGVMLMQNLAVPGFAWLRAENRALLFSIVTMISVLFSLGASVVLVGVLGWGATGALIGAGSGYVCVVVCTLPFILIWSRLHIRWDIARSLLSFGTPLIVSVISVWVLQLSDRYLLGLFGTWEQTASYSVAYSLGSVLSTVILAPFALAWPTAMYSIARRKNAEQVFQKVFLWFSSVLLFAALGLSLVSSVLFGVLFPRSYQSAAPVIPIVAESIAFYGVYTVLMLGANVRRRTWMTSVFTTIAALINVGCNLVLIPRYGAMGAAASTLIAYVALAVVAYVANQRIYPVPYRVGRFVLAVAVGVAVYVDAILLPHQLGARWTILVGIVGLLIYGVWLALLGISAQAPRANPALPSAASA